MGITFFATERKASAQELIISNLYSAEIVNRNDHLKLQHSFNQARNNGHMMDVWVAYNSNTVFMSIDNGKEFTFGNAVSYMTPTVAPWGFNQFMVVFVGTDGQINWSIVDPNNRVAGSWRQIPNQSTNKPVSITQLGAGEGTIYMTYRGNGDDTRIWGTMYSVESGWSPASNIATGRGLSEPAVTYNPVSRRLFAAVMGLNHDIWMTSQPLGAKSWNNWQDTGGLQFNGAPAITSTSNGWMVLSALSQDIGNALRLYNANGDSVEGWVHDEEEGGFVSNVSTVELAPVGSKVWALYTDGVAGQNQGGENKRVF